MKFSGRMILFCLVAVLLAGCAGTAVERKGDVAPPDPVVELQEKNIGMLNTALLAITNEINMLKRSSVATDPFLKEIYLTDLEGMKLRREQLAILLEHCRYAKAKLLEAKANPARKAKILEEWKKHRKEVMARLTNLSEKQDFLKRRRVKLDFDLVEKALQE